MAYFFGRKSGRILLSFVSIFLGIVQMAWTQEKAQSENTPRAIRLSPEQIPAIPGALPVFRLSKQEPPMKFVQESLRRIDSEALKLVPLSEIPQLFAKGEKPSGEIVGAMSEGHLAAYVDLETGDGEIFASLTRQKPVPEQRENVQVERAERLAQGDFLRTAKISLLHSAEFHSPFYWAPFQLYAPGYPISKSARPQEMSTK